VVKEDTIMPTYVEYDIGDGATILVEAPEDVTSGVIKASRGVGEVAKTKAKKSFTDALEEVKIQAKLLLKEIEELHVNEAEIKFGINTVGELGNMAIGKVGIGVNYEVTLKWKKSELKP
jgi:hypothetical protein